MKFVDGTPVPAFGNMQEIYDVWDVNDGEGLKGKQLPPGVIKSGLGPGELFDGWICPLMQEAWRHYDFFNNKTGTCYSDDTLKKIYLANTPEDEATLTKFYDNYIEDLVTADNCWVHGGWQNVYLNPLTYNQIKQGIDKKLEACSVMLRFRVLCVCVILQATPEEAFGASCFNIWRDLKINQIDLTPEKEFALNVTAGDGEHCYPVILRNASLDPLCFKVKSDLTKENWKVYLPANGCLRALFADKEFTTLVELKGNISFADRNTAVVLDQGGACLRSYDKWKSSVHEENGLGTVLDGGAMQTDRGEPGVCWIDTVELHNTVLRQEWDNIGRPIRCYGAGKNWALLYEDGSLRSNVGGGEERSGVRAVVENGILGFFFSTEDGCWRVMPTKKEEISLGELEAKMMGRFAAQNYYEVAICNGDFFALPKVGAPHWIMNKRI